MFSIMRSLSRCLAYRIATEGTFSLSAYVTLDIGVTRASRHSLFSFFLFFFFSKDVLNLFDRERKCTSWGVAGRRRGRSRLLAEKRT